MGCTTSKNNLLDSLKQESIKIEKEIERKTIEIASIREDTAAEIEKIKEENDGINTAPAINEETKNTIRRLENEVESLRERNENEQTLDQSLTGSGENRVLELIESQKDAVSESMYVSAARENNAKNLKEKKTTDQLTTGSGENGILEQLETLKDTVSESISVRPVTILCNKESKPAALAQLKKLAFPSLKRSMTWKIFGSREEMPVGSENFNANVPSADVTLYHPSYIGIQNEGDPTIAKFLLQLVASCSTDNLSACFPVARMNYCSCNNFVVAFILITFPDQEVSELQHIAKTFSHLIIDFRNHSPDNVISMGKMADKLKSLEPKVPHNNEHLKCDLMEAKHNLMEAKHHFTMYTHNLLHLKLESIDQEYQSQSLAKRLRIKGKALSNLLAWYQDFEHSSLMLSQSTLNNERQHLLHRIETKKKRLDNRLEEVYALQNASMHLNDKRPPRYWFGGLLADEVSPLDATEYLNEIAEKVDQAFSLVDDFEEKSLQTCNSHFQARFERIARKALSSKTEQQTAIHKEFAQLLEDLQCQEDLQEILTKLEKDAKDTKENEKTIKARRQSVLVAENALKEAERDLLTAHRDLSEVEARISTQIERITGNLHKNIANSDLPVSLPSEQVEKRIHAKVAEILATFDKEKSERYKSEIETCLDKREKALNMLNEKKIEYHQVVQQFEKTKDVCLAKAHRGGSPSKIKTITSVVSEKKEDLARSTEYVLPQNYRHAL